MSLRPTGERDVDTLACRSTKHSEATFTLVCFKIMPEEQLPRAGLPALREAE
jgi:hypothetical protein